MKISVLSIDLAKRVYQLHGVNSIWKRVYSRRVRRDELVEIVSELKPQIVVMEACGGSHYRGREFLKLDCEVKLIPAQHVKPYVKGNKTDQADAAAIIEAFRRDGMKFVSVKTIEQQSIQAVHRIREQLIVRRTALANEIRGLTAEFGVVLPQGISRVRSELIAALEENEEQFDARSLRLLRHLHKDFRALDLRVAELDKELKNLVQEMPICARLQEELGVGPVIATAYVAAIGNPHTFKNGRAVGAWIGLTPREHSSGEKQHRYGITKRGDKYLRKLLVHGARSVVRVAKNRTDKLSVWIQGLVERRGYNRAVVAVAHKMARQLWVIMAKDSSWEPSVSAI